MGQYVNSIWYNIRKGRIILLNFYFVQCKIEYNRSEIVVKLLFCNIMGYIFVNFNFKFLKYGCEMEFIVRFEYVFFMKKNYRNVIVLECGIFIDLVWFYLVVIFDLFVFCFCCGNGVVEFKCFMILKCNDCIDFCICYLLVCLNF